MVPHSYVNFRSLDIYFNRTGIFKNSPGCFACERDDVSTCECTMWFLYESYVSILKTSGPSQSNLYDCVALQSLSDHGALSSKILSSDLTLSCSWTVPFEWSPSNPQPSVEGSVESQLKDQLSLSRRINRECNAPNAMHRRINRVEGSTVEVCSDEFSCRRTSWSSWSVVKRCSSSSE